MKTAEIPENRSCMNCAFADGCPYAAYGEVCDEHKFDDEIEDEPTEKEKQLMYGDYMYQCYKEDNLNEEDYYYGF